MAGTTAGGKKTAKTNKKRYGDDFYARIGSTGGKSSNNGGFHVNRELAKTAGSVGGKRGKIGYKLIEVTDTELVYRRKSDGKIERFKVDAYK